VIGDSANRPVGYVRYEGENGGHPGWSYADGLDYANRVIEWFDRHLAGNSADA
jgi:hypothetical protein